MSNALRHWIYAARMRILPASAIPTIAGIMLAAIDGAFDLFTATITVLSAMMLQTTSNYLNDLYDFKKGADLKRIGPPRAVASGMISESAMMKMSWIMFILTFLIGLILVQKAGWPILFIGLASLWAAFAYTGGPYPLAYHGLGEATAFVFYGLIPVWGAYYIQSPDFAFRPQVILTGIIMGLFAAKILLVNNIRDIETDPIAGKITLAVMLGEKKSRFLYALLMILSYGSLFLLARMQDNAVYLMPWILLPFAVYLTRGVLKTEKETLNPYVFKTAIHLFAFGIILCIAMYIGMQK
ncbi:MAG: 1,4-dihydroxy-2-naphthoate polyprenyltransferase [Candidatus Kapaibacteriota bacterium]